METRPRVLPLLFGAFVASAGLGAVLVESNTINWAVATAVVLIGVSAAAFAAIGLRRN